MDPIKAMDMTELLGGMSAEDAMQLLPGAEVRVLDRNDALWRDGDQARIFAFVVEGCVKLVSADKGHEAILDLALPGQMICASAVCAGGSYCCRALALSDQTSVLVLPQDQLLAAVARFPQRNRLLLRDVSARARGLCARVEEATAGRVEQRIARLLLRLLEEIGQPTEDGGVLVPLQLSRQETAELCGTTVETSIRTMSKLARANVVKTVHGGFKVLNRAALEQICQQARGEGARGALTRGCGHGASTAAGDGSNADSKSSDSETPAAG